ncbi:ArsR/SmtB family transcription factor [Crocosphaera chwakensis]|uniref:Transcriptional regulator n=1 Tax=Crocosphaera chwakensis CCY0110 TaxID=391612 RepID=A3IQU1_9CHRO|nr:metalloregulator ArsR/SmtB family transcription factor [Crocosphaera chwakensis]EAZ91146.1 transcriptional regulator [Crocosphaera chwakensis CCY0110]
MVTTTSTKLSTILLGFRALSDPIRLQVLELLKSKELCVCDLCEKLDISQSKLSFHLKNLKEAKLVRSRQEGRWIYYRLNLSQFAILEGYLFQYQQFQDILSKSSCQES